jgi:hypothetical protein
MHTDGWNKGGEPGVGRGGGEAVCGRALLGDQSGLPSQILLKESQGFLATTVVKRDVCKLCCVLDFYLGFICLICKIVISRTGVGTVLTESRLSFKGDILKHEWLLD